jgi:hypothetical protein
MHLRLPTRLHGAGGGRAAHPTPPLAEATESVASAGVRMKAAEADANTWNDPRGGPRVKRPENAAGTFWVDSKCIDCDTCR